MAEPSFTFPRPGSWRVKLSAFALGTDEHVKEGSRVTVAEAVEGWVVTFLSSDAPPKNFDGRTLEPGVLEAAGPPTSGAEGEDVVLLRPGPGTSGDRHLVGIWAHRAGREDSPVGVWVSEEDTREPDESD